MEYSGGLDAKRGPHTQKARGSEWKEGHSKIFLLTLKMEEGHELWGLEQLLEAGKGRNRFLLRKECSLDCIIGTQFGLLISRICVAWTLSLW